MTTASAKASSRNQARRLAKSLSAWNGGHRNCSHPHPAHRAGQGGRERKGASERLLSVSPERRRSAANGSKHLLLLGRGGVSNRLAHNGGNSEKARSAGPALSLTISAKSHLPSTLQLPASAMAGVRTRRQQDRLTTSASPFPKRSGGTRLDLQAKAITAESSQQWVQDTILRGQPLHPTAAAFRRGVSIVDNARLHSAHRLLYVPT